MKGQSPSIERRQPLTGKHVLWMMLGFFGVIIAVNGVFTYFAIDSWPGLSTNDAYRKGIAYNDTLKAAERQNKLGWRSVIAFTPAGTQSGRLHLDIRDDQDRPQSGLSVEAHFDRPTHEGFDRTVTLRPNGQGRYQTDIALPLPGRWRMTIEARMKDRPSYRIEHELMVK